MSIQRVLIVDDDPLSREFLSEAVKSLGYQVQTAEGGAQGLEQARSKPYDLVLTDLRMPGLDGIELIREISRLCPGLPTVLITAHGTIESAVQAMREGAVDFLVKPCTPDSIDLVIQRIDHTRRLELENEYLRSEVVASGSSELIARSKSMLEILRSASRIASSKGTVLITGESGTGKERVAHFIHQDSPRRDGPFIRVNCAALPEQLLESELFGHERGAFTGAHKSRAGRFELADRGTLMLDEIGEISPAVQAKLLRVLEEEEFERVGGTTTMSVDVRVIATTNRDLPSEVSAGRFREDLYYRLHVLPIHLTPLRERPEDVLPLAEHFAEYYARQNGLAHPAFAENAREQLCAWSWPGNVRELENVIQRAVVLGQGEAIEPQHLLFGPSATPPGAAKGGPTLVGGTRSVELSELGPLLADKRLADIEREAILATISSAGGNKTEAARRLGVTARTLSNKMKLWRQMGLVA